MRKKKGVSVSIDICDFCGISFDEYYNGNPPGNCCGFEAEYDDKLGWVHKCPTCSEIRNANNEVYYEIIGLLRKKKQLVNKVSKLGVMK